MLPTISYHLASFIADQVLLSWRGHTLAYVVYQRDGFRLSEIRNPEVWLAMMGTRHPIKALNEEAALGRLRMARVYRSSSGLQRIWSYDLYGVIFEEQ